jgi:PTH2 family peptidyl-tRNA hydrolase
MRIEERTMRQLIIARKDLQMSPGKLAAQVSHASMAFLTQAIRENIKPVWRYRTMPSIRTNPLTGEKGCRPYKRADLCLFAKQAYEAGKETFTVRPVNPSQPLGDLELCENEIAAYSCDLTIDKDVYEQWIQGIFTKTICEARNRNHMMKAATMAEELGLKEGTDFFLIKDNCLTELEPEEVDENGIGRTLTCIGFRPLSDDLAHTISRKYQLYR